MLRAVRENGEATDLGYVLRSTTTDDLNAFLAGPNEPEIAWLSPISQHEEAWFVGLRLNAGVQVAELEREFGARTVAAALAVLPGLQLDGLLTFADGWVRLTPQGRLLSNEVFQEFLGLTTEQEFAGPRER
jgi:oxygen-independent coproporphyrinogen-3 oxidase